MDKKLVFWGIGNICKVFLENYPDSKPIFFIDSFVNGIHFAGKRVVHPDEIVDWKELYIVITCMACNDIEKELYKKGLIYGEDFCSYFDYLGDACKTIDSSIEAIEEFANEFPEYLNSQLVMAPLFIGRDFKNLQNLFKEHCKKETIKSVFLTSICGVSLKNIKKQFGYPVLEIPDLKDLDNLKKGNTKLDTDICAEKADIIYEIDERKTSENREKSFELTKFIYLYFEKVLSILKPQKMIIWCKWSRESYVLENLANKNHIIFGFMEHGWIPGTYQVDKMGIAGQSEYAVYPEVLNCIAVSKNEIHKIREIKNYITKTQLDSRHFKTIDDDVKALAQLDMTKKIVFFVGMDDAGMGINPDSGYWTRYVSSCVKSTKEAVMSVAEVCREEGWNLIFKPHPNPHGRNRIWKGDLLKDICIVTEMSIDSLISMADVIVSIASAVDYKVMIYEKPLVSLGKTTLRGRNCEYEVDSKSEIAIQLRKAISEGITREQIDNFEKHMAQLLKRNLWDDLSERELRYGLPSECEFISEEENR